MDKVSLTEEYIKLIEDYLIIIGQITYDTTVNHLEVVESSVLDYLHINFPNMVISKEELHETLNRLYQNRNFKLKKAVECDLGKTKYDFEANKVSIEEIIKEEIGKLRILFTSVNKGTNFHYFGLVDECIQEIMGILIRKNTSLSFAKKTEAVREEISKLLTDNYKVMMDDMGNLLIKRIVIPLENKYFIEKEKVIIK